MTLERKAYDPRDLELTIATRPDGLRFLMVAGLAKDREYELLNIIAQMQTEDAAKFHAEPKPAALSHPIPTTQTEEAGNGR